MTNLGKKLFIKLHLILSFISINSTLQHGGGPYHLKEAGWSWSFDTIKILLKIFVLNMTANSKNKNNQIFQTAF